MQNAMQPLIVLAAFPVDGVTKTDGLSRLWFGLFKTLLTYLVIVVIKNLFLTPVTTLKNIWNGFEGDSFFLQLICDAMPTALWN